MRINKKIVSFLFIGIAFSALFVYLLGIGAPSQKTQGSNSTTSRVSKTNEQTSDDSLEATPFPFQELTIPYLRSREYTSQLAPLEEYERNSQHTQYLTSYDSDGLRVNALLTIPTVEQPEEGFPAVVFVHGYIPPNEYSTTDNYESYVNYLAERGLVVFKIDLRGHGNSEGLASGAYFSGDYVIDVLNAYTALENADFVNQNKIGLWGHSMAGNVVLRSAAVRQNIPRVVIWAGAVFSYTDFYDLRISDSSYQPPDDDSPRRRERAELMQTYGEFSADSWFWEQVPATNFLDSVQTEFQLHHAENDSVVDIEYSEGLVEIFDEKNIRHDYFRYSSGGHNISGSAFNIAMQRTADFLLNN